MKILIGIWDGAAGARNDVAGAGEYLRFSAWPTLVPGGREVFLGAITQRAGTLAQVIVAPAGFRIDLEDDEYKARVLALIADLPVGTRVRPSLSIRQHMTLPQRVPAEAWELEIVGPH